jgi:glycosyltransferase involved in cell wall biosynthesis
MPQAGRTGYMKVLNVNMTIDPAAGGGTAERTVQMSRYLARKGVDCTILTTDGNIKSVGRTVTADGVRIISLPVLPGRFYIPRDFSPDMVADADIVHLMNHWTVLNAVVYRAALRLHKPYVVCPAGSLQMFGRSRLIKKIYRAVVGERIIRRADGYIAVTSDEVNQFCEYGVLPDRVSVIPNGICDTDDAGGSEAGFRRKFGLDGTPFILFVGRLSPIKGPDLLLQAFCNFRKAIPNVDLVFAGPDEGMLPDLQRIASESGMAGHVHFIGYINGNDKVQAYRAASLLAVPSRREAMSIVALEAGINGTPVLLTDQCGFDEVARIGGGLVAPATVEGIQEGLRALLGNPPGLRGMGERLRAYVFENYLWDNMVYKYISLYERILAGSAAPPAS